MEKLGSHWDSESADRFYKAYCKFGKEWGTVAARVPGRSPAMVKGMYRANRTYLSLPDSERSVQAFQALVQDMFARANAMDTSSDESAPDASPARPHATRSGGSRSRRGGSARGSSGKQSKSKHTGDDGDEVKGRGKRKRELFPEPQRNQVPGKRMRKSHTSAVEKKPSSTGLDSLLAAMGSPGQDTKVKLKTKFKGKDMETIVEEKGSPTALWFQGLQAAEGMQPNTKSALLQLHHCLKNKKSRRWAACEWFYGAIDRLYFAQNEFKLLLANLGIPHISNLTRTEWSYIRGRLGRPRRLSALYLQEERTKLHQYRAEVRAQHAGRQTSGSADAALDFYLEEIPAPINVGQRVLARHPSTGELYLGNILLKDSETYRVQFDDAQLGVVKIRDAQIMPHPFGPPSKWTRRPTVTAGWPGASPTLPEQLHTMLTALGVQIYADQPIQIPGTLSESCQNLITQATSALELHIMLYRELPGVPEESREAAMLEIQKVELTMSTVLEQLEACSGELDGVQLPAEMLAEQCFNAALRVVQQMWSSAEAAAGGPAAVEASAGVVMQQLGGGPQGGGSIVVRQRHANADNKRLQDLLAGSVAMMLAMHDSARYPSTKIAATLEILAKKMQPLGKLTMSDNQEIQHSVNSFCEATRLLESGRAKNAD